MIFATLLLFLLSNWYINGYMIEGNPYRRAEFLDSNGKYHLEWMVSKKSNTITFNVTVNTQGWILFGLASNAEEGTSKDVVVGGVIEQTGVVYFSDKHEEGNGKLLLKLDKNQDYKLRRGWEVRNKTFLSFSRDLDTGDAKDFPVTQNKISVIWAYGKTDNYDAISEDSVLDKGSYDLHLLDIDYSPRIIRDRAGNPKLIGSTVVSDEVNSLQLWSLSTTVTMPSAHTNYLCSMHRAPRLSRKHHIVGGEFFFPDESSLKHPHHIIVQRCSAPRGVNARHVFEPFLNVPPQTCFFLGRPSQTPTDMPFQFCTEVYYGWAVGARPLFMPPDVGIPLGDDEDEYYLMQVHYDNPELEHGINVTVRLDYWYTSQLRPNDGGAMAVGAETLVLPPTILIPPQTKNHRFWAHCGAECTKRILPPEGINVYAVFPHSHDSGKAMKVRHFDMERNVELPWISYDDNYSNRLQNIRPVSGANRVLPGHQLTLECTYDNTWTNNSVVNGFATKQEMCSSFLFYYGRIREYSECRAQIVDDDAKKRFLGGLRNITWVENEMDWVATTPSTLSGLTVTEISNRQEWSEEQRNELRSYQTTTPMVSRITKNLLARSDESVRKALQARAQIPVTNPPVHVDTEDDFSYLVGYPFGAKPYLVPATKHNYKFMGLKVLNR